MTRRRISTLSESLIDPSTTDETLADLLETTQTALALKLSDDLKKKRSSKSSNNNSNTTTIIIQEAAAAPPSSSSSSSSIITRYEHTCSNVSQLASNIRTSLQDLAKSSQEASQSIKLLEQKRRSINNEIQDLSSIVQLRHLASEAQNAYLRSDYHNCAVCIYKSHEILLDDDDDDDNCNNSNSKNKNKNKEVFRERVGANALQQLEHTESKLKAYVLQYYTTSLQNADLQEISRLTPLLGYLRVNEGTDVVQMYIDYSLAVVRDSIAKANNSDDDDDLPMKVANIYNPAVNHLRHHLPMVSRAFVGNGDVKLLQSIHALVEESVLSLFDKELQNLNTLRDIYQEKIDSNSNIEEEEILKVDQFVDDLALVLQYSESYDRFIQHTLVEVHKIYQTANTTNSNVILSSALNSRVAELGGNYAVLEHLILSVALSQSLDTVDWEDGQSYSTSRMASSTASTSSKALQSAVMEEIFYVVHRSILRAIATGHLGTACAAVNHCSDTLDQILPETLVQRTDDSALKLKPGKESGLLVSLVGEEFFGDSLMDRTAQVTQAMQKGLSLGAIVTSPKPVGRINKTSGAGSGKGGDIEETVNVETLIAYACASYNDIEVAIEYTKKLEEQFMNQLQSSYNVEDPKTEQLKSCIKSFGAAIKTLENILNRSIEQLTSQFSSRLKGLIGEAVTTTGANATSSSDTLKGGRGGAAVTAASNAVSGMTAQVASATAGVGLLAGATTGGGSTSTRATGSIRMNYDLDETTFELLQAGDGYMERICSSLDILLSPLLSFLTPGIVDKLLASILEGVCKKLEGVIRLANFTSLGALNFDSDCRFLGNFFKARFTNSSTWPPAYSRLTQIASLLNATDVEDAAAIVSSAQRRKRWNLSADESEVFLKRRTDLVVSGGSDGGGVHQFATLVKLSEGGKY